MFNHPPTAGTCAKVLIAVLIGTIIGLWFGVTLGSETERYWTLEWKAVSFACVDRLTECKAKVGYCPEAL